MAIPHICKLHNPSSPKMSKFILPLFHFSSYLCCMPTLPLARVCFLIFILVFSCPLTLKLTIFQRRLVQNLRFNDRRGQHRQYPLWYVQFMMVTWIFFVFYWINDHFSESCIPVINSNCCCSLRFAGCHIENCRIAL